MDDYFEKVAESLSKGDAVLFLGAGFSRAALNCLHSKMPIGDELKVHLFEAVSHVPSLDDLQHSLDVIADHCLAKPEGPENVADRLRKIFTAVALEDWQIELVTKFPWKRIYTTNYDNCVEFAFDSTGKKLAIHSATESFLAPTSTTQAVVHLNGKLDQVRSDNVSQVLRLGFRSYAESSIENSRWADLFEREVTFSGATAFVGFRLPDLDIARLLIAKQISKKTAFIVGDHPQSIGEAKLENFGTVLRIDAENFVSILKKKILEFGGYNPESAPLRYFKKLSNPVEFSPANDSQRIALLVYGNLEQKLLAGDLFPSPGKTPYTIKRSVEAELSSEMSKGLDVAIVSRLGNGKSVFLARLGYQLLAEGWTVYFCLNGSEVASAEAAKIGELGGKVAVIFDGALQSESAIGALCKSRIGTVKIVFSERSTRFDARISDEWLIGHGITEIFEHRLDQLDEEEVDRLIDLVDQAGLWGHLASKDHLEKQEYIKRSCRSEISSTLLHAVKSKDISERIRFALNTESISEEERRFLILATAISVTIGSVETRILAKLASHQALNEFTLRTSEFRNHLYSIRGNTFQLNSALFGSFFLLELVPAAEVLDVIAGAIRKALRAGISYAPRRDPDDEIYTSNEFPSSLYVFRNLHHFVDASANQDKISWFYEEIRRGTDLKNDPLYWLQYSIGKFFARERDVAKRLLDTAYGVAKKTPGFFSFQIDNQYARYLLENCATDGDSDGAYEGFLEAHRIIADQAVNASHRHYPFKVAQAYPDILVFHRHSLSDEKIEYVVNAMKLVYSRSKIATVTVDKKRVIEQCQKKLARALRREGVTDFELEKL